MKIYDHEHLIALGFVFENNTYEIEKTKNYKWGEIRTTIKLFNFAPMKIKGLPEEEQYKYYTCTIDSKETTLKNGVVNYERTEKGEIASDDIIDKISYILS